jgi:hypothetical protein
MGMIVTRRMLPAKHVVMLTVLLIGALAMTTGCSPWQTIKNTGKSISGIGGGGGDGPNKQIGFLPFENRSALKGQPYAETFQSRLKTILGEACPDLRLTDAVGKLSRLPRLDNGMVDNLALAAAGRRSGLNAVAAGALISITDTDRTEGWFWFKNPHHYVQVQIAVDVYDTQTGAKLLYESITGEMEIEEYDYDATTAGDGEDTTFINSVLDDLAEQTAEKICDAFAALPWVGFVVEAGESAFKISSGSLAGLVEGQVLDVFTAGKVFATASGQEYLVPGPKIGALRIQAVRPEQADAVSLSGKPPVVGDTVRIVD